MSLFKLAVFMDLRSKFYNSHTKNESRAYNCGIRLRNEILRFFIIASQSSSTVSRALADVPNLEMGQ
jgi:hypothetical protein